MAFITAIKKFYDTGWKGFAGDKHSGSFELFVIDEVIGL
jgi:hypothetical protein